MTDSTLTKILKIHKQCKDYLSMEEYFDALSLILAIAKRHHHILENVVSRSDDFNDAEKYFFNKLEQLLEKEPHRPWYIASKSSFKGPVIVYLARFILHPHTNISSCAATIRDYYGWHYLRSAPMDLALFKFFQALLGNVSDKSLIDSNCGLGFKTLNLHPKHHVLNNADPFVAALNHRLCIAEGFNVECYNRDYLAEACEIVPIAAEIVKTRNATRHENTFDIAIVEPATRPLFSKEQQQKLQSHFPFTVAPETDLPSTASTSLWIQHTLRQLKAGGTAYVIVSDGWLSRGGYDAVTRHYLLENRMVEAVISLNESGDHRSDKSIIVIKNSPNSCPVVSFSDRSAAIESALARIDSRDELGLYSDEQAYYAETKINAEELLIKQNGKPIANLNAHSYISNHLNMTTPRINLEFELQLLKDKETEALAANRSLTSLLEAHKRF